jgi:hypothetical protein
MLLVSGRQDDGRTGKWAVNQLVQYFTLQQVTELVTVLFNAV